MSRESQMRNICDSLDIKADNLKRRKAPYHEALKK